MSAHGTKDATDGEYDTVETDRVRSAIAEQIAVETDVAPETIDSALDALDGCDVSPDQAKPSLVEQYAKDGPTIYDISGIGHVRGHYLLHAGYDTPEAVAGASLEDLTMIPYLGERTASEVRDAAREYIETRENTASGSG